MTPRICVTAAASDGTDEIGAATSWHPELPLDLPETGARHVQVLRLQPGDGLVVFDGRGGEWQAEVLRMGRKDVQVRLLHHVAVERELHHAVTLAVGMPSNDRMDALVEKATELGVSAIQPLVCNRSVLRLDGERAIKRVAHWQSVAVAACEQSGRTRVPQVHGVMGLKAWLASSAGLAGTHRALLSFAPQTSVGAWLDTVAPQGEAPASDGTDVRLRPHLMFLSGPEGGLAPEEEDLARAAGWQAVGLGPRVLRADTAPLMALALVAGREA